MILACLASFMVGSIFGVLVAAFIIGSDIDEED